MNNEEVRKSDLGEAMADIQEAAQRLVAEIRAGGGCNSRRVAVAAKVPQECLSPDERLDMAGDGLTLVVTLTAYRVPHAPASGKHHKK